MYSSLPRGALSIMRMQLFFPSHCQQQQVSFLMKQTEVFGGVTALRRLRTRSSMQMNYITVVHNG